MAESSHINASSPGLVHEKDDPNIAQHLLIPAQRVVAVEHPCIIKNLDKGFKSLGGEHRLNHALASSNNITASLRPDDPFAKQLTANSVKTQNVLLKITVPKRTGRKRKRGTTGPFLTEEEIRSGEQSASRDTSSDKPPVTNPYVPVETVFRRIQDNADKYTVTPIGVIEETHRFRNLPDLQHSATGNRILKNVQDHLLPLEYQNILEFPINLKNALVLDPDVSPPPLYLQTTMPFAYSYRQNAGIKFSTDQATGEKHVINLHKKVLASTIHLVPGNETNLPTGPKPHLPPENQLTGYQMQVLYELRLQLEDRPIITRHVLYSRMGWNKRDKIREILPYCGYIFDSGPFRECLCKYGVDPRSNPEFRHFQTMSYLTYRKAGFSNVGKGWYAKIRDLARVPPESLVNAYKFDGKVVSKTGNLFQMCDITDPVLRTILDTPNIRDSCAPTTQGWYHAGTWAKAQVILRDKVNILLEQRIPDDSLYARIITWPEDFDPTEMHNKYRAEFNDKNIEKSDDLRKEYQLMNMIRSIVRNPRYSIDQAKRLHRKDHGEDGEAGAAGAAGEADVAGEQVEEAPDEEMEDELEEDVMDLDNEVEGPEAEVAQEAGPSRDAETGEEEDAERPVSQEEERGPFEDEELEDEQEAADPEDEEDEEDDDDDMASFSDESVLGAEFESDDDVPGQQPKTVRFEEDSGDETGSSTDDSEGSDEEGETDEEEGSEGEEEDAEGEDVDVEELDDDEEMPDEEELERLRLQMGQGFAEKAWEED